jgi:hypothetical protein
MRTSSASGLNDLLIALVSGAGFRPDRGRKVDTLLFYRKADGAYVRSRWRREFHEDKSKSRVRARGS